MLIYRNGPNPTKLFEELVEQGDLPSGTFTKLRSSPFPLEGARSLALLLRSAYGVGAIPVAPDAAFRTRMKTVTVGSDEEGPIDLLLLAQERFPSALIANVEVLDDRIRTRLESHRSKKRVIEWEVRDHEEVVLTIEPSVSKALREARRIASTSVRPTEVHVRGLVVGEGSPNYATYRLRQVSRRVKIRVTYVETTRRDPAPTGWLFVARYDWNA